MICNTKSVYVYDDMNRGVITSNHGVNITFGWLVSKKASQV
jgi:hypothetical protein